jgi:hypothetical protein
MALHTIVELRRCPYPALCKKDGCDDAASLQARYVDEQGRTLRKHEFANLTRGCWSAALRLGICG